MSHDAGRMTLNGLNAWTPDAGRMEHVTLNGLNAWTPDAGRMSHESGRMTREPCLDIEKMSMYLYHDVSFPSKLVGNDTS